MSTNELQLPEEQLLDPITEKNPLDVEPTIDGTRLTPLVIQTETSGAAEVTTYTDQCGREEADSQAQGNAQHTIEGLFDKQTVQFVYALYQSGDKVEITLPANIDTVGVFLTDVTIKQGDSEHIKMLKETGVEVPVWHTQIQLKQSGAIEDEG